MDAFGKILATILVELLRYFQSREDLKALVRAQILAAGMKSANDALGWKVEALGTTDGGATLVVRDGALQITIPGYSASAGSVTVTPVVQPGAEVRGPVGDGPSSDRP